MDEIEQLKKIIKRRSKNLEWEFTPSGFNIGYLTCKATATIREETYIVDYTTQLDDCWPIQLKATHILFVVKSELANKIFDND